jgi:hypothetical protein
MDSKLLLGSLRYPCINCLFSKRQSISVVSLERYILLTFLLMIGKKSMSKFVVDPQTKLKFNQLVTVYWFLYGDREKAINYVSGHLSEENKNLFL